MGWFEEGYTSTHGNFKREMMNQYELHKKTAFCGILLSEKSMPYVSVCHVPSGHQRGNGQFHLITLR